MKSWFHTGFARLARGARPAGGCGGDLARRREDARGPAGRAVPARLPAPAPLARFAGPALAGLVAALAACASPTEHACRVGGDCASGVCNTDGTCAPAADDAGTSDSSPGAADARPGSPDANPAAPDGATSPDAPATSCANQDGTITRGEVTFAAGAHENMRIGQEATVDTAGMANPDGTRAWDLSGMLANDQDVDVATLPLAGTWYAGNFPDATYAAQLSQSSTLLGVFRATDTELQLVGVVSPDGNPATRTLLTYDPPATILRFPLAMGASFSSTSTVSGQAPPVFLASYVETYDSTVDATGTLATPFGSFPVLRLRTTLTRTTGGIPTIVRTFTFVAECYGAVAVVTSNPDETQTEFTTAAEARRIAR
jgi:hypothetical protein